MKETFTSARILSFCSSPGRFVFSVCLPQFVPLLPPSTPLLAQQAKTHTQCNTHSQQTDKIGDSVMRTEGCDWSKVASVCVLLWITARYRNKTSLHFNVVFLLFCTALSFFCWCTDYRALRNPFVSLWFKWSHITEVNVLWVKAHLLTRWTVFLPQTRLFCVWMFAVTRHSICVFLWSCLVCLKTPHPPPIQVHLLKTLNL